MKNRSTVHFARFSTPEELFCIRPDAPRGLHLDALNATLARAEAITTLLATACADLEEGYAIDQATLADTVWCLTGLIEQARAIARHVETGEGA